MPLKFKPVEFASYLSNARSIVEQDAAQKDATAPSLADRQLVLKGRSIVPVPADEVLTTQTLNTRKDFVESIVRQFGEQMRSLATDMFIGKNAKPLTARTILQMNDLATEATQGEMNQRLRSMSQYGAQAATGPISQSRLATVLKGCGPQAERLIPALEITRQTAEGALAQLSGCTGRELAEAYRAQGGAITREQMHIRELIQTVIDRYFSLGDQLRTLYNQLGGESEELYDLIERCNSRATELQRIVIELAHLEPDSTDKRLNQHAALLLPMTALQMHDTTAAMDALQAQLRPLADRIDALQEAATRHHAINWVEANALQQEIAEAKKALQQAATNGIHYPGTSGTFRPSPAILNGYVEYLDAVQAQTEAMLALALKEAAQRQVDDDMPQLNADKLFKAFQFEFSDEEAMALWEDEFNHLRELALLWVQNMNNAVMLAALNNALNNLHVSANLQRASARRIEALKLMKKQLSGKELTRDEQRRLAGKIIARLQTLDSSQLQSLLTAIGTAFSSGQLTVLSTVNLKQRLTSNLARLVALNDLVVHHDDKFKLDPLEKQKLLAVYRGDMSCAALLAERLSPPVSGSPDND